MKNVIITGGTGFIGQYMIRMLIKNKCEVYAVVRKKSELPDFFSDSHCHIIVSDLADLSNDLFPFEDYDVFLHLAWGGVNREEIDDDGIHMNNYNNSKKCIHTAVALKCNFFVDVGSRAEYGNDCMYCKEDIIGNPSNSYGYYKKKFYEYAFDYCNNNICEYVHFRLFSVIGPGDHPWSLVSTACRAFLKNEELRVGACSQLWNFMSVNDVCESMLDVIKNYSMLPKNDNRIINIASADTRILKDYIETIWRLANSKSTIIFDSQKIGFNSNPSIEKLSKIFLWKDKIAFEDEILRIFEGIKNEKD